jgi:hypothetical protein
VDGTTDDDDDDDDEDDESLTMLLMLETAVAEAAVRWEMIRVAMRVLWTASALRRRRSITASSCGALVPSALEMVTVSGDLQVRRSRERGSIEKVLGEKEKPSPSHRSRGELERGFHRRAGILGS